MNEKLDGLLKFIDESPCSYHAVKNIIALLKNKGFVQLFEKNEWNLMAGKSYFVVRNDSSIIAFKIPEKKFDGFYFVASHSDSPCFRIKENPEIVSNGVVRLNVEKYGGMLMQPWFDRPLSIAGRVALAGDSVFDVKSALVKFDDDLAVIPHLAIHFDRDANDGKKIDVQKEILPVISQDSDFNFKQYVAQTMGVDKNDLLSFDMFLYNRDPSRLFGSKKEFFCAPRIDDLECVYVSLLSFVEASNENKIIFHCVFDNEEVGSLSRQGADSTFLEDCCKRINESFGLSQDDFCRIVANSFFVSADNAHGVHPNYSGTSDPVNQPRLNGGPVIKFNGNQKYTSDSVTAAVFKRICDEAKVPFQVFTNNSNVSGGSTLGNISMNHLSMPAVDIGLAQWAMHSPNETAGTKDVEYLYEALKLFYKSSINIMPASDDN